MGKVENAVILAAGTSSRFAPLSYEKPKGLLEVKGEVLIERQIHQLREAGIRDIYVVTGYKAEQFAYLKDRFQVELLYNPDYATRNNNASIHVAAEVLGNSYVCSADDYFEVNPFEVSVDGAYYAAVYSPGKTDEWCMETDVDGYITNVTIGGRNAWYMLGHTFWDRTFSERFLEVLEAEYDQPETLDKLWEGIYKDHLDVLYMKMRKYPAQEIFEFDTLDELRRFDPSYIADTRSVILKKIAKELGIREADMHDFSCAKDRNTNQAMGFSFEAKGKGYSYSYPGDDKESEQDLAERIRR